MSDDLNNKRNILSISLWVILVIYIIVNIWVIIDRIDISILVVALPIINIVMISCWIIIRTYYNKVSNKIKQQDSEASSQISPKDSIDTYIQHHITPFLKSKGFNKVGRTWRKHGEGITYIVNLQADRWNNSEGSVRFYINYAIYSPKLYFIQFKKNEYPAQPNEYDCVFMFRKRLRNEKSEELWYIEEYDSEQSNSLIAQINSEVLPYFESFKTQEDLEQYVAKQKISL